MSADAFLNNVMECYTMTPLGTFSAVVDKVDEMGSQSSSKGNIGSHVTSTTVDEMDNIRILWKRATEESSAVAGALRATIFFLETNSRGSPVNAGTLEGLVDSLQPLISGINTPATKSHLADAYVSLLPNVVDFILYSTNVRRDNYLWALQHYRDLRPLEMLFAPFHLETVEPYEKELYFHFVRKCDTAKTNQPQVFFNFCRSKLTDIRKLKPPRWCEMVSLPQGIWSYSSVLRLRFLSVSLSIFRTAYHWKPYSPTLQHSAHVVNVVNTAVSFLSHDSFGDCHDVASLYAESFFFTEGVAAYCDHTCGCIAQALQDGNQRMWRRSFLKKYSNQPLYNCTLHFIRSIEAVLQRLNEVQFLNCALTRGVWWCILFPSIREYGLWADTQQKCAVDTDSAILRTLMLIAGIHLVGELTEKWAGVLQESPREALALLTGVNSRLTSQLHGVLQGYASSLLSATAHKEMAAQGLDRLNKLLGQIHQLPDSASPLLVVLKLKEEIFNHPAFLEHKASWMSVAKHYKFEGVQQLIAS